MYKAIARLFKVFIPQFLAFRTEKEGLAVQLEDIVAIMPAKDNDGVVKPNYCTLKLKSDEDIDVPFSAQDVVKAINQRWQNVGVVGKIEK
ncbi:MAG: hypothetical protein HKO76_06120 [Acidimicrobiia bacterium]|nr:hypothetical protein [Acidimicrobiia bacterium]